ncbi:MAG: homoserine kinase [Alphaproteobacteria bacterium]|nr:homoserine kinase [Alphaproteobacteria bacterium]
MAVYTDVSFEELEEFLSGYDVGRPLSFKGIAEGVENSNFFLRTDSGAFILTLYEKRVRETDLPFFLGLMDHLASRGIACPLPLKRRDGTQWAELNGRPATLLTYLNGVSLRHPAPEHCAAVGAKLAALHEAGADFALYRPNALSVDGWREMAAALIPRADEVEAGLGALIETTLENLHWPHPLPSGVIHADLFPDNVLFVDGKVSGLIDFYFACNDAFAYDLAVMLNAWCFDDTGRYDTARGAALLGGYRELSPTERDALPVLARGAALRFLLTRLHDVLHRDPQALVRPKDPRDFARRLRFHLGVRRASDYGL